MSVLDNGNILPYGVLFLCIRIHRNTVHINTYTSGCSSKNGKVGTCASNLCGKNNSVISTLRKEVPHLILVKCICHSLHLCAEKATHCLPDEIEFLVSETVNWFSRSTIRRSKYKTIFKLINNDNDPLKLTKLSQTRWLSRYEAINKIVNQYLELKTNFNIAAFCEKCHITTLLSNLYENNFNYLFLVALRPLLKQICDLNTLFQSNNINFCKAQADINLIVILISKMILKTNLFSK